jgi:phenylalanine-4-hydroxylase
MVPVVELGERRVFASLQQANKALKKMFYFSLAAVAGLVAFVIFMRRAFN